MALVVKNLPANSGDARDVGLIHGLGRSCGGGNGNPIQYSCVENSMDRGAWWATVHGVIESQTQLGTGQATHSALPVDATKPSDMIVSQAQGRRNNCPPRSQGGGGQCLAAMLSVVQESL